MDGDVPQAYLQGLMLGCFRAYVTVTEAKLIHIVRVTRGQSTFNDVTTKLWLTERCQRIASSITGTIAKCRCTAKVASRVEILLDNSFRASAATQHGHNQETGTRDAYLEAKCTSSPGICTKPTGLVIHPTHH